MKNFNLCFLVVIEGHDKKLECMSVCNYFSSNITALLGLLTVFRGRVGMVRVEVGMVVGMMVRGVVGLVVRLGVGVVVS